MFKKYTKQPIFKGKNSLSELEKDFIELNDIELKEVKLFLKSNNITIVDMDRFA